MSRFGEQPLPCPAAKDYGPRDRWPTLAVVWHVAEGRNVAQYLSRDPLRGVSVHYTVEQETDRWKDGEVVRCLPEDRISGSINPRTIRRSDDPGGYYGASHAKAALGSYWPETSPNCLVISVEVAGRAAEGPTEAQVRSMVALWDELNVRHPKAVPLGHRDCQDVKPCPGRTVGMKAAFAAMGGHGTSHMEVRDVSTRDYVPGRICTVRASSTSATSQPSPMASMRPNARATGYADEYAQPQRGQRVHATGSSRGKRSEQDGYGPAVLAGKAKRNKPADESDREHHQPSDRTAVHAITLRLRSSDPRPADARRR